MFPIRFQRIATASALALLLACDDSPTAPAASPDAWVPLIITDASGSRNAQLLVGDSVVISVAANIVSAASAVSWKVVSGRETIGIRKLNATTVLIKTFVPGSAMIEASTADGAGTFAVGVRLPSYVPFVWTPEIGMQRIPVPHGVRDVRPTAVNNRGEVVGSFSAGMGQQAFYWSQASGFHAITESRNNESAIATAINNHGFVVGELSIEWTGSVVFAWAPGEGFRTTGIGDATPRAINDAGQVVGGYHPSGESVERAFSWQLGTSEVRRLPDGSVATDVNNSGYVVGYSNVSGNSARGVMWGSPSFDPSVIFEPLELEGCDLGSPTFWGSEKSCQDEAASVNDAGEVAGTHFNRAFRWTGISGVKLLELPAFSVSWGRGINAGGDVVGHGITSGRNASRPIHEAFVWRSNGEVTRLGKLPGTATTVATAINDNGMVVGYAR